jgi:hypothetical protein
MKIEINSIRIKIMLISCALIVMVFALGRASMSNIFTSHVSSHDADDRTAGKPTDIYLKSHETRQNQRSFTAPNLQEREENFSRIEDILRGANVFRRCKEMMRWLTTIHPTDFAIAAEQFRLLGYDQTNAQEYNMLLSAWAEIDPIAAIVYATEGKTSGEASSAVLAAWSSKDPDAALKWAEVHREDTKLYYEYVEDILIGLSETDPQRASRMIADLFPTGVHSELLIGVLPHLGSDETQDWIDHLPEGGLKNMTIAIHTSNQAKNNPQTAMNYIDGLPLGETRTFAIEATINSGIKGNVEAAAKFIDAYNNDVSDNTIVDFSLYTLDKFPKLAVDKIRYIKDESTQLNLYQNALSSWLEIDRKSAMDWISNADLPKSVRKIFLDSTDSKF